MVEDAEMNAIFTWGINVATMEKLEGLLAKTVVELPSFARWNGDEDARTGDSIIRTISSMYMVFALAVEKSTALYCCKEVFEFVSFTFELRRSW